MYGQKDFMCAYVTFCDYSNTDGKYYLVFCELKRCFQLALVGELYVKINVMDFKLLPTGLFEFVLYPKDYTQQTVQAKTFILNYAGQDCVIDSEFLLDESLGFPLEIAVKNLRKRVREQEKLND